MKSTAVVIVSLLLVGSAAVSAAGPVRKLAQAVSPSIVNGKNSDRVGWYVSLAQPSSGKAPSGKWPHICGGMLITQTTVLTAAHCVFNKQGVLDPPEVVAIGIRNLATDKPGVDYDRAVVDRTIVHPRYLSPFTEEGFDIAILELDPVTVTGKNQVVSLPLYIPKPRDPVPAGNRLQLIGFGELGNGTYPTALQRTELVLEPLEACNEAWAAEPHTANFFESTAICAGAPRTNRFTDACRGDSGGPLFAPRTVGRPYDTAIGLVSYGDECDVQFDKTRYGKPGVYTNIAQLKRWITANIACLDKDEPCPWGGTCFDNPANGCASCNAKHTWACGSCAVKEYAVNGEGQCRPVDCRNLVEDCIECTRHRPHTCAACAWGYKLVRGQCVPKTCLDYDRGCQQCDPASPLACTACKLHHVLDPASGRCVRMHQVHP